MKCRHCGNKILGDVKFCTLCGNPVGNSSSLMTENVSMNNTVNVGGTKRKLYYDTDSSNVNIDLGTIRAVGSNNATKAGCGCLGIFFAFFFIMFFGIFIFVFSFMNSFESKKYFEFGEDVVPTVYEVVGKFNTCSYSSSSTGLDKEIIIEYCDNDFGVEEIREYIDYLVEEEGFEYLSDSALEKDSLDTGYKIVVRISSDDSTISYEKSSVN